MRKTFVITFILVVLSVSLAHAGIYDHRAKWRTIQTKHFAIHFAREHEPIAGKVAGIAEEVYESLTKKFDRYPKGKTEVVLLDTHDNSNGFATVVPYNMLTLRVVAPSPENNLGDYDEWLRELFLHEFTHVIHLSDTEYPAKWVKFVIGKLMAPNGTTPGWIREGLAAYFETVETTRGRGRSSFTDMLLRTDILQGKFLKLDQMAGSQFEWPSWLAQYLYGVRFMDYIAEKYGEKKLIEFSHSYGSTLRFFSLNSHAKRVFRQERDAQLVHGRCIEPEWSDKGTWEVKRTYPEFCGPQGETFYDLWTSWKKDLEQKYAEQKAGVESSGLQEGEVKLAGKKRESLKNPTYSPDGKQVAYVVETVDGPTRLILKDLETDQTRILLKKKDVAQISFSPDGTQLVFSAVATVDRYHNYSDLHLIDIASGKIRKLTKGERGRDPSFSPDGKKILFVKQSTGYSQLAFYDLEAKQVELTKPDLGKEAQQVPIEYNHPRWSPNGKWIAVSKQSGGQRNLWLVDTSGHTERKLTNDVALEDRPAWDASGRHLYYSSDRSGISNIYRYDLETKSTRQMTNVLTGAFAPSVSPVSEVAFQYYTGKGYEVRTVAAGQAEPVVPVKVSKKGKKAKKGKVIAESDGLEVSAEEVSPQKADTTPPASGTYRSWRQLLLPRFIYPNGAFVDSAVFLSGTVQNTDPLQWHAWTANVNYRSDNNFVGYGAVYSYQRFIPAFFAGYNRATVNYGDLYGVNVDYFEKRQRGYGGVAFPLFAGRAAASYFFEDRTSHSGIPATAITFPTTGKYAGLHTEYKFGRKESYPASISIEKGFGLGLNADITNRWLGSADHQEQQLIYGDIRGYIPVVNHQVIALRGAGGVSFGDRLTQGNYSIGGSLGESPFTQTSTRLFTVRGLPLGSFSRDDVWVASAEYRIPLFRVQRGLGTLPFFLNSAHFALFTDVGDAFNRNQTPSKFRPMLSVGGELRGDFVIAYGIPLVGRVGYGIVLTNRGRLAGLEDPFSGAAAKNGVIVFDVGTSF